MKNCARNTVRGDGFEKVQCILTTVLLMDVSYFRSAAKEGVPIVWELKLYQKSMGGSGGDVYSARGRLVQLHGAVYRSLPCCGSIVMLKASGIVETALLACVCSVDH
jgi:hypothetical protein